MFSKRGAAQTEKMRAKVRPRKTKIRRFRSRPKLLQMMCFLATICLAASLVFAQTPSIEDQTRYAKEALLAQRYPEAIQAYKKLLVVLPKEPGLRFNLALAFQSSGKYREALQQLEMIRGAGAANPKFWFLLGLGYLKLDLAEKAIEPLRRSLALDSTSLDTRQELAEALLENGNFLEAEAQFRQLSATHERLPKALEGMALSELFASREAYEHLEKVAPGSSYIYGLAAVAAADSHKTARAIQFYEKALLSKPAAPWMRNDLAALKNERAELISANCTVPSYECLFARAQWEEILSASARVRTAEGWYWRSRAYSELAKRSIDRLATLPPSAEQHELLAKAFAAAGQSSEAVSELRQAAELRPGDELIEAELAEALLAERKFDEAVDLYRTLLVRNESNSGYQFGLGDALLSLGQTEEAIQHLGAAVKLNPLFLPARAKLGEALVVSGHFAEAIPHLVAARSIDKDGSIHFQLASAYRHIGKQALAAEASARQKQLQQASTGLR